MGRQVLAGAGRLTGRVPRWLVTVLGATLVLLGLVLAVRPFRSLAVLVVQLLAALSLLLRPGAGLAVLTLVVGPEPWHSPRSGSWSSWVTRDRTPSTPPPRTSRPSRGGCWPPSPSTPACRTVPTGGGSSTRPPGTTAYRRWRAGWS